MRIPAAIVFLPAVAAEAACVEPDPIALLYEKSGVNGGLVVELGIADAEFTARLGAPAAVTLQTLDTGPQRVDTTRKHLDAAGLYGKIRWVLIARDAFNGVLLWKRPLKPWGWQEWKPEIREADWRTLRGQRGRFPAEIPRRLVVVGDRVYVTLGFYDAPISILDAATGELLMQCEGTEGTRLHARRADGLATLLAGSHRSHGLDEQHAVCRRPARRTGPGRSARGLGITLPRRNSPSSSPSSNRSRRHENHAKTVCERLARRRGGCGRADGGHLPSIRRE